MGGGGCWQQPCMPRSHSPFPVPNTPRSPWTYAREIAGLHLRRSTGSQGRDFKKFSQHEQNEVPKGPGGASEGLFIPTVLIVICKEHSQSCFLLCFKGAGAATPGRVLRASSMPMHFPKSLLGRGSAEVQESQAAKDQRLES